jgi:NitT/TauT family transport system ATP-binding protein
MGKSIDIEHLSVTFPYDGGRLEVFRDFSLQIRDGEFLSILGPSGCGKSTLLKVIGGLLGFDTGSVLIDGELPDAAREHRALGYVFQNPVLFGWRTVLENVMLPAEVFRARRNDRIDNRSQSRLTAQEMIDLVGLRGFENAYPGQLSGGMQSRVAIARALSYHPEIILMDEPFGDLDEITRTHMNSQLIDLWAAKRNTIVFVTHSIHESVFLSDRVAVLSQRPSHVTELLPIDLPRPRTVDTVLTPSYVNCMRRLQQALGGP